MKKVALYCRVSTRDQEPENQVISLTDYAKRQGFEYEVFVEKESTRKTRPVKYELMQCIRNGQFDRVIVWKMDRWARSTLELLQDVTELYEKGVVFVSIQDNIDLSTSAGKLQFRLLSAFAEFERDIIRERTILGLERARKQGKQLGRPKGRKDQKDRRKSGYYLRWQGKKPSPIKNASLAI